MPPPPGAVEIPSKRGLKSKTYDLPGNKRRHQVNTGIRHTPDDYDAFKRGDPVSWEDINLEIGPNFNAWYSVTRRGSSMRVAFKTGGHIDIKLAGRNFTAPVVNGNKLEWNDIDTDLDLWMEHRPAGVEIFKRLKGPGATNSLTWEFVERPGDFRVQTATTGRDALNNEVEISHVVQPRTRVGQDDHHGFSETLTGRSFVRNPVTRVKEPVVGFQYPVVVDASFEATISAEGDDGFWYTGNSTWTTGPYVNTGRFTSGLQYYAGFRFQSIDLAKDLSIDTSYLYVEVLNLDGYSNGTTATIKIDDVDDAPAWSNSSHPPSTSFTGYSTGYSLVATTTGSKKLTVTAAVQHVLNRAGWASGQSMRFGDTSHTQSDYNYVFIQDYSNANEAKLVINYTPAGGASTSTALRSVGRGIWRGVGAGF